MDNEEYEVKRSARYEPKLCEKSPFEPEIKRSKNTLVWPADSPKCCGEPDTCTEEKCSYVIDKGKINLDPMARRFRAEKIDSLASMPKAEVVVMCTDQERGLDTAFLRYDATKKFTGYGEAEAIVGLLKDIGWLIIS